MLGPGMIQQIQSRCSNCSGNGYAAPERIIWYSIFNLWILYLDDICTQCDGSGLIKDRKEFKVVIEKGMQNGQKITFVY